MCPVLSKCAVSSASLSSQLLQTAAKWQRHHLQCIYLRMPEGRPVALGLAAARLIKPCSYMSAPSGECYLGGRLLSDFDILSLQRDVAWLPWHQSAHLSKVHASVPHRERST